LNRLSWSVTFSSADALRRRVRRDQVGVLVLEPLQLVVEPVVGGVGDLGIVEDVVAVEVMIQLGAELVDPRLNLFDRRGCHLADASEGARRPNRPSPGDRVLATRQ
jgi:hypothetical protein